MVSYISLAAPLAFRCHGPLPPAAASSRLRQMPGMVSLQHMDGWIAARARLTGSKIPPLSVRATEPVRQESTACAGFLVRHLVQLTQPRAIGFNTQFGAEDYNVEVCPLPLGSGLLTQAAQDAEHFIPVEAGHVRCCGVIRTCVLELGESQGEQTEWLVQLGEVEEVERIRVGRRLDACSIEVEFRSVGLDLPHVLNDWSFQMVEPGIGSRRSRAMQAIAEIVTLDCRNERRQAQGCC